MPKRLIFDGKKRKKHHAETENQDQNQKTKKRSQRTRLWQSTLCLLFKIARASTKFSFKKKLYLFLNYLFLKDEPLSNGVLLDVCGAFQF